MAGLYFTPDTFTLKNGKTILCRYRPIEQSFPKSNSESPYYPVFLSIQEDAVYFCLDELYAGYQIDLFRLPLTDLTSEQQKLTQVLSEMCDPKNDTRVDIHDYQLFIDQQLDPINRIRSNSSISPKGRLKHFSDLGIWGSLNIFHKLRSIEGKDYFVVNHKTLFLDFLFDLRFTDVFQNCPHYPKLQRAVEKLFPLNTIYLKAQFYYRYFDLPENRRSGDTELKRIRELARDIVQSRREYENFLKILPHWFSTPQGFKGSKNNINTEKEEYTSIEPIENVFLESNRIFFAHPILFLASNPREEIMLQLGREHKSIAYAIQSSKYRDKFHIIPRFAATLDDLRQGIVDHKPKILHFAGHGTRKIEREEVPQEMYYSNEINIEYFRDRETPKQDDIYEKYLENWGEPTVLIFEDDDRKSVLLDPKRLINLISSFPTLRCVYFNACCSSSIAQEIAKKVHYVIGNHGKIYDRDAIDFSSYFYRELGGGNEYFQAFINATEYYYSTKRSSQVKLWTKVDGKVEAFPQSQPPNL